MLITINDPEKYTNIRVEEVYAGDRYGGSYQVGHRRALLGMYTVSVPSEKFNDRTGQLDTKTVDKVYAVTADLTSAIIAEGLQRAENMAAEVEKIRATHWVAQREAELALETTKQQLAKEEAAGKKVEREMTTALMARDAAEKAQSEALTRMALLEGHLAKVKSYFGEKAYNEALAGKVPSGR